MMRFFDVAVTTIMPVSLLILYKLSFPVGLKMSSVSNLALKLNFHMVFRECTEYRFFTLSVVSSVKGMNVQNYVTPVTS
jgi:hypothetical protein